MPIIEQHDILEMMARNHQALLNLRTISDAVAGHPCDAKTMMAALGVVRVNGERAGRQARRMLRALEAEARSRVIKGCPEPTRFPRLSSTMTDQRPAEAK